MPSQHYRKIAVSPPSPDLPPGTKTRACPHCRRQLPLSSFLYLPHDQRCDQCVPEEAAMLLRDRLCETAILKFKQILESAGMPACGGTSLDTLLDTTYEEWGGSRMFVHRTREVVEAAISKDPGSNRAINYFLGIYKLEARRSQLRKQDEWEKMSADQLKQARDMELAAMLMEWASDNNKRDMLIEMYKAFGMEGGPEVADLVDEAKSAPTLAEAIHGP